ncbi:MULTISPECIES: twin-arginine translocase subunit TatC [Nocardiopsidaceae]|uniref:Sec-independent protein translocase protein TatC n=2 Tax=Nocardiopsidaceae TaxID=83676 RepID=A0ABY6YWL7_9ACTN|nr:twin-arginine translocase subunit TatC [Streptomonospora nanhaiensis]WAE76659.1 twin-arginine translocase subunit TatC [Streptomonospora nanhaiensis]
MPLMEHLRELRSRLTKAAIALALGAVVGYLVYDYVWAFLVEPYCSLPVSQVNGPDDCSLIVTGPFDAFFVAFKVWLFVGALVSAPFWLYQLWAFVAPALHGREKKYAYLFAPLAALLFAGGAALAYAITSMALTMLFGFLPEDADPFLTIGEYLNYMLIMMGMFGIGFVLPLLVVLLNISGVLPHAAIAKWRRVIIFSSFVIAAVITPAEPISMLALAVPLVVLFEIAELFAFLNDRRKKRDDPYAGLDDDEISELDDTPSALDEPDVGEESGKRS